MWSGSPDAKFLQIGEDAANHGLADFLGDVPDVLDLDLPQAAPMNAMTRNRAMMLVDRRSRTL